ncbi:MipA/OmpV family protein [Natronospira bacteriovora]|uniref:MipA/OmpV family protein n=1 Tax=Natronospira bacteriovora TaxID=3069753 RepID=A0ABU0W7T7_9GAMM|nr:MipA/OmpV family protein [Natronospira sp. AB-CW4]MDQ2070007.1 MipA/OmpV family protein [Natronospira sp. AB-CW4]
MRPPLLLTLTLLLTLSPELLRAEGVMEDDERGTLEYGIGLTHLNFPHYPGADQRHAVTLPFPFLTYYSDRLDVDGSSIRGLFWEHEAWSLDISTGGALRVDADDNEAREDMPGLGWLAEVGPALRYAPEWAQRSPDWQYRISLPLRQAIELDGTSLSRKGWLLAPNLHVKRDFHGANHRWEFQTRIGLRFGSRDYHEHFYGVGEAFETTERPAYQASEGLTAYTLSMGLAWRWQQWWLGGFVQYSDFSDGIISDSPLMRDTRQAAFGLSGAWILGQRRL